MLTHLVARRIRMNPPVDNQGQKKVRFKNCDEYIEDRIQELPPSSEGAEGQRIPMNTLYILVQGEGESPQNGTSSPSSDKEDELLFR